MQVPHRAPTRACQVDSPAEQALHNLGLNRRNCPVLDKSLLRKKFLQGEQLEDLQDLS